MALTFGRQLLRCMLNHYILNMKNPSTYIFKELKNAFETFCNYAKMSIVSDAHYMFSNDTSANTGVLVLATSHFAWHTFPEHNYISIQYSTCSEDNLSEDQVKSLLELSFKNNNIKFGEILCCKVIF